MEWSIIYARNGWLQVLNIHGHQQKAGADFFSLCFKSQVEHTCQKLKPIFLYSAMENHKKVDLYTVGRINIKQHTRQETATNVSSI